MIPEKYSGQCGALGLVLVMKRKTVTVFSPRYSITCPMDDGPMTLTKNICYQSSDSSYLCHGKLCVKCTYVARVEVIFAEFGHSNNISAAVC